MSAENAHAPITTSMLLRAFANEFPGEAAALSRLPTEEGADLLRTLMSGVPEAPTAESAALDLANRLRPQLGLDLSDTAGVEVLTPEESDRFDSICASALR